MEALLTAELRDEFAVDRLLLQGVRGPRYLARDLRSGREAWLHVLIRRGILRDGEPARFNEAMERARTLEHPHLLTLRRSGSRGAILWFSTDLPTGLPLRDRLARGPFTPADARRLLQQVAGGLDHAHRRGLEHGALTLDDILLDRSGWVQVLGTGIADGIASNPDPMSEAHFEALVPPGRGRDQRELARLTRTLLLGLEEGNVDERPLPRHVAVAIRRATSPRPIDRFGDLLEFVAALEDGSTPTRTLRPVGVARPSAPPPVWQELRDAEDEIAAPLPARREWWRWIVGPIVIALLFFGYRWITWGGFATPDLPPPPIAGPDPVAAGTTTPSAAAPPATSAPAPAQRTVTPPRPRPRPTPRTERATSAPRSRSPRPSTTPAPASAPTAESTIPVAPPLVPVTPSIGTLTVSSRPWGDLALDGTPLGHTPLMAIPVQSGRHRLRIARDGYVAFDSIVEVHPGRTTAVVDIVLKELAP